MNGGPSRCEFCPRRAARNTKRTEWTPVTRHWKRSLARGPADHNGYRPPMCEQHFEMAIQFHRGPREELLVRGMELYQEAQIINYVRRIK